MLNEKDLDFAIAATTGIGSLPHHSLDSAFAYSFRFDVPFLPQLPAKNAREFMVPQALEGIPGLSLPAKGECLLRLSDWEKGSPPLSQQLDEAFKRGDNEPWAFEQFEPTAESYSAWRPFLWELEERKSKVAKVQITGPLTAQWALKLDDGAPADKIPEVGTQIFRLLLARSISMVRRLHEQKVTPIIFLDEPGFYCYSRQNPRHLLGLQELKLFIHALKREKAIVGLHCCSNTDWGVVLSLAPDYLSVDTKLSLVNLLRQHMQLSEFLERGSRLSLGVIPTANGSAELQNFEPEKNFEQLTTDFLDKGFPKPSLKKILAHAFLTPACGLALHTPEDAEIVLGYLSETQHLISQFSGN